MVRGAMAGARGRADALLWVHAFRYVALQIFAAQQFGWAVKSIEALQIGDRGLADKNGEAGIVR